MTGSYVFVLVLLCSLQAFHIHGKPTDQTEREHDLEDEEVGQIVLEHNVEGSHETLIPEGIYQGSKSNKDNLADYSFPDTNQESIVNDENEDMIMMADEHRNSENRNSDTPEAAAEEKVQIQTSTTSENIETVSVVDESKFNTIESTTTEVNSVHEQDTLRTTEKTSYSSGETTTVVETISETTTEIAESTTVSDITIPNDSENVAEEEYSFASITSTTESNVDSENTSRSTSAEEEKANKEIAIRKVNRLSDQIRLVLQQYKNSGSITIPDVPIPDPMTIPDMDQRVSMASINFKNMKVYGLRNFTVQHINTDLEKMQVYMMLKMERLIIIGNYSMRSFFSRASGPFNVMMYNVTAEGAAQLQRDEDGQLEASETDMDMYFDDIHLDFKNLGFMGTFFQGVMGTVGSILFDGIKPFILVEVNTNMRNDINAKIKTMADNFKMSEMNPVDQAVVEGRRYVKDQGYDPYLLQNYTKSLGLLTVNITEFQLQGLSRFYRVGEIALSMDSGIVEAGIHVATDRLRGSCVWSVGVAHTELRKGRSDFTINHLQLRGLVQQSLDLTVHPRLHDLDILLGKIELKTNRQDTLDYILETVVNHLPSLMRHIIVDALEEPIKIRVQEILDEVDVETLVDENLPALDNFGV